MKNKIDTKMYQLALGAYNNAYTPYSKFNVGAVIKLKDGSYITGSNIENASYSLTICAERAALFSLYSKGYKKEDIEEMLILGKTKEPISPCGACRQVMSELMDKDALVVLTNFNKDIKTFKVKELLPYNFEGDNLNHE